MHKITKGLKKKKKGKKSKHKEEELFKPEELEAYRREHQAEESGTGQNEEWKKFIALTSGVDDILKKTQGDLDRIKSTSFFQRVPPPSEVKKEEPVSEAANVEEVQVNHEVQPSHSELGIVQVSESESEEEEEDDIFDTAYIDAIAAGEVKLAYIPESPTEQQGDDPFDTSIAERAILGPAVERKGKKLVPIGAAVEVLTGRVQLPTCATTRPTSSRRQILKEKDLLLGSFDDNANSLPTTNSAPTEVQRTLLDDDAPLPLADEPIDLSKTLHQISAQINTAESNKDKQLLDEFDVIQKDVVDEDDEDFALLAAESLSKTPVALNIVPVSAAAAPLAQEGNWAAFQEEKSSNEEIIEDDPFDTTFAENIVPGKAELKVIESEILDKTDDLPSEIFSQKVSINVTDPAGQRESISSLDRVSESDLNLITPIHRDLLGGSNTDLSNLNDKPLKPAEQVDENYIEYCDPFDTSIVETAKLPGQTELKFLEKELLGDLQAAKHDDNSWSDEEFDPRAGEPKDRTLSRPDVLNITTAKTVSFDLPTPPSDLLATEEICTKITKPLTPFYVRKHSVPEQSLEETVNADPFDTSFVSDIGPGKVELKLIESELFDPATERTFTIADQDFDPRDEKKVKIVEVLHSIKEIANKPNGLPIKETKPVDLLADDHHEVAAKVLTPAPEQQVEELSYVDPFDTSIATNIVPGKTELKLLETELIHSHDRNLSDSDFDPRAFDKDVDFLDNSADIAIRNPLNPVVGEPSTLSPEDIDPFDTSIANNIVPGRTELKLLESELI